VKKSNPSVWQSAGAAHLFALKAERVSTLGGWQQWRNIRVQTKTDGVATGQKVVRISMVHLLLP